MEPDMNRYTLVSLFLTLTISFGCGERRPFALDDAGTADTISASDGAINDQARVDPILDSTPAPDATPAKPCQVSKPNVLPKKDSCGCDDVCVNGFCEPRLSPGGLTCKQIQTAWQAVHDAAKGCSPNSAGQCTDMAPSLAYCCGTQVPLNPGNAAAKVKMTLLTEEYNNAGCNQCHAGMTCSCIGPNPHCKAQPPGAAAGICVGH
jgi:hypothetical protein